MKKSGWNSDDENIGSSSLSTQKVNSSLESKKFSPVENKLIERIVLNLRLPNDYPPLPPVDIIINPPSSRPNSFELSSAIINKYLSELSLTNHSFDLSSLSRELFPLIFNKINYLYELTDNKNKTIKENEIIIPNNNKTNGWDESFLVSNDIDNQYYNDINNEMDVSDHLPENFRDILRENFSPSDNYYSNHEDYEDNYHSNYNNNYEEKDYENNNIYFQPYSPVINNDDGNNYNGDLGLLAGYNEDNYSNNLQRNLFSDEDISSPYSTPYRSQSLYNNDDNDNNDNNDDEGRLNEENNYNNSLEEEEYNRIRSKNKNSPFFLSNKYNNIEENSNNLLNNSSSSSSSSNLKVSIFDRLYNHSKIYHNNKKKIKKDLETEIDAHVSNTSFIKNVKKKDLNNYLNNNNNKKTHINNFHSIYENHLKWKELKERNLEKLRNERLEKELQECTGSPSIKTSKSMRFSTTEDEQNPLLIFHQLYEDSFYYRNRREHKELLLKEEENQKISTYFKPKVLPNSIKIANKKLYRQNSKIQNFLLSNSTSNIELIDNAVLESNNLDDWINSYKELSEKERQEIRENFSNVSYQSSYYEYYTSEQPSPIALNKLEELKINNIEKSREDEEGKDELIMDNVNDLKENNDEQEEILNGNNCLKEEDSLGINTEVIRILNHDSNNDLSLPLSNFTESPLAKRTAEKWINFIQTSSPSKSILAVNSISSLLNKRESIENQADFSLLNNSIDSNDDRRGRSKVLRQRSHSFSSQPTTTLRNITPSPTRRSHSNNRTSNNSFSSEYRSNSTSRIPNSPSTSLISLQRTLSTTSLNNLSVFDRLYYHNDIFSEHPLQSNDEKLEKLEQKRKNFNKNLTHHPDIGKNSNRKIESNRKDFYQRLHDHQFKREDMIEKIRDNIDMNRKGLNNYHLNSSFRNYSENNEKENESTSLINSPDNNDTTINVANNRKYYQLNRFLPLQPVNPIFASNPKLLNHTLDSSETKETIKRLYNEHQLKKKEYHDKLVEKKIKEEQKQINSKHINEKSNKKILKIYRKSLSELFDVLKVSEMYSKDSKKGKDLDIRPDNKVEVEQDDKAEFEPGNKDELESSKKTQVEPDNGAEVNIEELMGNEVEEINENYKEDNENNIEQENYIENSNNLLNVLEADPSHIHPEVLSKSLTIVLKSFIDDYIYITKTKKGSSDSNSSLPPKILISKVKFITRTIRMMEKGQLPPIGYILAPLNEPKERVVMTSEEIELLECTGKPKLITNKENSINYIRRDGDICQHLYNLSQIRREKQEMKRKEIEENELSECTFQPMLIASYMREAKQLYNNRIKKNQNLIKNNLESNSIDISSETSSVISVNNSVDLNLNFNSSSASPPFPSLPLSNPHPSSSPSNFSLSNSSPLKNLSSLNPYSSFSENILPQQIPHQFSYSSNFGNSPTKIASTMKPSDLNATKSVSNPYLFNDYN